MSDRNTAAHVIYVLTSTREPEHYRYVGQSRISLRRRMSLHLYLAQHGDGRDVYEWMRTELAEGNGVHLVQIEKCASDDDVLNEREQYWIERLRSEGHDLRNMIRGGSYTPLSDEGRAKIRVHARAVKQTPNGQAATAALVAWSRTPEGREAARAKGKQYGASGGRAAQKWRRETSEGRALTKRLAVKAGRAAAEWRRNTPEGRAEVKAQTERLRAVSSKGAKVANHNRHHRDKGIVNPRCDLCRQTELN